ncbi:MAG: hypothetical protein EOP49_49255 [Sphingobacteriales bacterium]|nr:MAG: hypothetical protein EOP49_49255 [Sphingobacteriales bacterium]
MNRLQLYLLLFSALAAQFSACTVKKEPAGLIKPAYYDLETLLDKQVKLLTEKKAGVVKSNQQGSTVKETKTIGNINWSRELDMFRQAAINRPAWRTEFTADSTTAANGQRTVTYRRNQDSDAPVEYLQVLLAADNSPLEVTAKLSSSNMLFTTNKLLTMKFGPSEPKLLTEYSVAGSEDMVFSDAVNYALRGNVTP